MNSLPIIVMLADAPPGAERYWMWDLGLSVGFFAAVFMLIVAIFRQGGRARMSPEREAAIATGHLDRRTVFENAYLRPLMWLLLVAAHSLAMPGLKIWLRRKLVAAGSPNYYTSEEYLALSLLSGLVLSMLLVVSTLLISGQFSFTALGLGLVMGLILSLFQIYEKAERRMRLIARRVPYALDLIALAMGAGATFIEAVRTIVRENPDDPFNVELKSLLAEIDLGATRRVSLQNLAARVPLPSLHSIVASVIQAEDLGTPLSDVMHSQATLLRLHRSVKAEQTAAVASVRILLPGLLILMSVVMAFFAAPILRAIRGGGILP